MPIGDVIRAQRETAGISVRALAALVGVNPAYLSRVERGLVPASEQLLKQLAKALGCPEEHLLLSDGRIPKSWQGAIDAAPAEAAAAMRSALGRRGPFLRPTAEKMVSARAGLRAIEDPSFPFEHLSDIAELESWRKEIHRPIYHMHKWWAQRLGSVFRGILLGCFSPAGSNVVRAFYEPARLPGVVVLDPFMGSGTTLGEALKLGARVVGRDINHVAHFAVRNAFRRHDLVAVGETYEALREVLTREIRPFYKARLANGSDVETLYYFWVKTVDCPACSNKVDLFSRYVFAQNAYPARRPEAKSLCPGCGAINEIRFDSTQAICAQCSIEYDPQRGPANRSKARCPRCKDEFSILAEIRKRAEPPEHRLYAKMVRVPSGEKVYLSADEYDLQVYAKAVRALAKAGPLYPPDELLPGHNTNQALNYGYRRWHQMFNARQLLALGTMGRRFMEIEDIGVRELFVCLLSGLVEFNNMFASFKGEGTGAVRHMFAHHILKPERTPLEANPFSEDGSGSLPGLFRRRVLRSLRYAADPSEVRQGLREGGRGEKVSGISEPIGHELAKNWEQFVESERAVFVSCGDSATLDVPTGAIDAVVTDPPFFDNVHYSELADFFHVWQRHLLGAKHGPASTRSAQEVQNTDGEAFSRRLGDVWRECGRVLSEDGLLVFTYHHSRHEGWKRLLESLSQGNFGIVAAHPVKSEMSVAVPKHQAKSPIDLDVIVVCRKRQAVSATVSNDVPTLARCAAESGAEQVRRFNASGRRLSRNDVRVVVTAQAVRQLSWINDIENALRMVDDVEAALERAIEATWAAQVVTQDEKIQPTTQLPLALA